MPAAFEDTFTGSAGTLITAHPADTLQTYANSSGEPGAAVITSGGRMRPNAANTVTSPRVTTAPGGANQYLEADIWRTGNPGATSEAGVWLRLGNGATQTGYLFRYDYANSRWEIWKAVAGAFTALRMWRDPSPMTADTKKRIRAEAFENRLRLYVDGVLRLSVIDRSVSTTGFFGFRLHGSTVADANGMHIDNAVGDVLSAEQSTNKIIAEDLGHYAPNGTWVFSRTLTLSAADALPVAEIGDRIVLLVYTFHQSVTTITDTKGNVYAITARRASDSSEKWTLVEAEVTTTLVAGDAITVNVGASTAIKVWALRFKNAGPVNRNATFVDGTTSTTYDISASAAPTDQGLLIAGVAGEGSFGTHSPDNATLPSLMEMYDHASYAADTAYMLEEKANGTTVAPRIKGTFSSGTPTRRDALLAFVPEYIGSVPKYEGYALKSNPGSPNPHLSTLPPGVSPGDLMIMEVLAGDKNTNFATPAGWTLMTSRVGGEVSNPSGAKAWYWYKIFAPGDVAPQWSGISSSTSEILIHRFSNVDQSNPIDAFEASGGMDRVDWAGITTTGPNRLLAVMSGFAWKTNTWTPPSGFGEEYDFALSSDDVAQVNALNFNGATDGTALTAWSEGGTTFTLPGPGGAGDITITSGRLWSPGGKRYAHWSQVPPSADYAVEADFENRNNYGSSAAIAIRSVDLDNHYRMEYIMDGSGNGTVKLIKRVAGVDTQLGSTITGLSTGAGNHRVYRLEAYGTRLRVYSNGVVAIEVTDSSFSAAGKAAVQLFGTDNPVLGIQINDLSMRGPGPRPNNAINGSVTMATKIKPTAGATGALATITTGGVWKTSGFLVAINPYVANVAGVTKLKMAGAFDTVIKKVKTGGVFSAKTLKKFPLAAVIPDMLGAATSESFLGAGGDPTISPPAGAVVGETLLMQTLIRGQSPVLTIPGWTLISDLLGGEGRWRQRCYQKTFAGEASWAGDVDVSFTELGVSISRWTPGTDFEVLTSLASTFGTALVLPNCFPDADSIVVACVGDQEGGASAVTQAQMTKKFQLPADSSKHFNALFTEAAIPSGQGTRTFTWAYNNRLGGVMLQAKT